MVTRTYQPMPIYLTCALIFILLNWGGMQIIQWGEKSLYPWIRKENRNSMSTTPVLVVENIHKSFGKVEILKGASFAVNKGETKVIIGPSGAGKSTSLNASISSSFLIEEEYFSMEKKCYILILKLIVSVRK